VLLDRDLWNRDVLDLLAKFNLYSIIQKQKVQDVIMHIWDGPFSVEAYPFQTASCYNLLMSHGVAGRSDYELEYRFYNPRALDPKGLKQHYGLFHIWKHSI